MRHFLILFIILGFAGLSVACEAPEDNDRSPQYRSIDPDEPTPSSGERGSMMVTEVLYSGSVSDGGVWDPEDVFIELQSRHVRPVNISGWHLILEGDVVRTIRLPEIKEPIEPNAFFVIAAKDDGAFAGAGRDYPGIHLDRLKLGQHYVKVELRDNDFRKMEQAGSDGQIAFTGGYDTQTSRSMERVQLIFANQGSNSRNWHAYSDTVGLPSVAEGYQLRTLASPGEANSEDYSGSAAAGNFE